jgi:sugar lactone lactonase YvrE
MKNLEYPIKGINAITGVALDAAGDLYVADEGANLILMMNPDGLFTTLAGPGPAGIDFYSGDGGAATNANLNFPFDVALDAAGNLYISDQENNRIRKVDTNGIITTVAGNGTNAFAGDGGPATNASLFYPRGVALDSIGNLYFADWLNNRIRKVDTNGIISTVAGNGQAADTGDGGAATNATLNGPQGVAVNACNLYIADSGNNRIREVHLAGFPALTLTNVTATNAGNYSVVITSPYGSVTSGVVSLTVTIPTTPPQIISSGTNFGLLINQFGFNLNGAYGQTIVVDGSTNLLDWTPLFTNTANGSPFYFSDPAWTNFPWRFYRARLP